MVAIAMTLLTPWRLLGRERKGSLPDLCFILPFQTLFVKKESPWLFCVFHLKGGLGVGGTTQGAGLPCPTPSHAPTPPPRPACQFFEALSFSSIHILPVSGCLRPADPCLLPGSLPTSPTRPPF